MKKTLCTAGALVALVLPASAFAADETPSAKQAAQTACKAERAEMGKETFRATWGTQNKNRTNAHRNCVRSRTGEVEDAVAEAKYDCKAERDADPAAFTTKYGTNRNGKNAYGKCVSQHAKASTEETTEDRVNAAEACKAEREADAAAFKETYGTNENKSNAFGKCVSQKAKAQNDEETAETAPAS